MITSCGHTYDKESIVEWLDGGHNTCPLCRAIISKAKLRPNNSTRIRIGLPELSDRSIGEEEESLSGSTTSEYSSGEIPDDILHGVAVDFMDRDYHCCGVDHDGYISQYFCFCAESVEYHDRTCYCGICCGMFSLYTLGSFSSPAAKTMCGIFYPLWLLFMLLLTILEVIIRIILMITTVVIVIILAVLIIAIILLLIVVIIIVIIILAIICIIGCIFSFPCLVITCCCSFIQGLIEVMKA